MLTYKKTEKKKEKVKLNERLLMKMTLIDDEMLSRVKEVEINYFKSRFGENFTYMRDIDFPLVYHTTILRASSLGLVSYKDNQEFIEYLNWVEELMADTINIPGCVCKILLECDQFTFYL